jgi:molecular chaperone GrpE
MAPTQDKNQKGNQKQPDEESSNELDASQIENNQMQETINNARMEISQANAPKANERVSQTIAISDIELENLKKELAECKDKYLRVLAESENARKRLQKEKQEMIQYAIQNILVDFLSPIDHMENALNFVDQMSDDVKHWAVGFQMILNQFKDVLAGNGVSPFVSEGQSFDPHRHEAIESVATADFPPGVVIEESSRGYLMGERTIRPARVKVSKAPL